MLCRSGLVARFVALIAVLLATTGAAYAVTALGTAKRVDVDPTGTPIYSIGLYYVIRTGAGGFAAAWEENTKSEAPIVYERIPFRIYNNAFAPVAGPRPANITGRTSPSLWRLMPLGPSRVYLVYAGTRNNPGNPDHPKLRDGFGQTIALSTGAASGARQFLNSTGNWDSLIALGAGLSDGRAVTAWYETDAVSPAPGRFVSSAGVPQPINLNFACCGSIREAQLVRLQPLGTNFLADYLRNSVFGNKGLYARVFKSNGQPLAAAKYFPINVSSPIPKALSNGRIVVFRYLPIDSPTKLVAQLYDQNWQKVGTEKTLIPGGLSFDQYLDFSPTLDGGLFMLRTVKTGSSWSRSVRRYDANLNQVAPDYAFAATKFDGFRIEAISSNRAVVLYRNTVGGRDRLFAQIVSY